MLQNLFRPSNGLVLSTYEPSHKTILHNEGLRRLYRSHDGVRVLQTRS
jgi:hypothetical protein